MTKIEIEKMITASDETLAGMMRDQIELITNATGKDREWSCQLINELSYKVMNGDDESHVESVAYEYATLIDNFIREQIFLYDGLTGLMDWNKSGKTKLFNNLFWYAKAYQAQVVLKTSATLLLATGQYD